MAVTGLLAITLRCPKLLMMKRATLMYTMYMIIIIIMILLAGIEIVLRKERQKSGFPSYH